MAGYDYEKNSQGISTGFEIKLDRRTKRFLEAIKRLKNPKILEVGMGQGRFLKKIAELRPDAEIYGIDISKTAIEIAKDDKFLEGTFLTGNAEKIPFQDNFFDVVAIMDVLEHLENPSQSIAEAKRVLAPSGIFHFYVPCEGQPFTLDHFLRKTNFLDFKNFTRDNFGHIQFFSHRDIKNITGSNFSKISITYSSHWISQIMHILTIYLPKKIISLFGKNVQRKSRDAYESEIHKNPTDNLMVILNKSWIIFIFPTSIIYEVEAKLMKNISFSAKGLHYTGRKII